MMKMNSNRRTLVFYINCICHGGAERVILQLAHWFAEAGYRSVLVTSFADPENEYEVPDNVVRLSLEQEEIKQSRLMRNVTRIIKLRRLLKREKPVAVVSFMNEPTLRSEIAATFLPIKKITSIRNDPSREFSGRAGKFISKYIIPRSDGVVFQTEDAKAWFPEKIQVKSTVIPNEVSTSFFDVQRLEDTRSIVTFGRLEEQKNHRLMISAFSQIAGKYPEETLMIYGCGTLKNDLQAQIDDLGLTDRIKLMGSTDEVPQLLAKAKLFVLASDYEGMPNALMEAMAVGVPCISTDCPCGGPRMLVEDEISGLLVPVGDIVAMSKAMDRLLGNEAYAKLLGSNAKKRAQSFRPDVVFLKWKYYIESLL